MVRKKITISEFARKVGVSTATVSRALNNKKRVSEATRRKILRAKKKFHYHPCILARRFSSNRSFHIGITLPHFAQPSLRDPFYPEIIAGVQESTANAGYKLLLLNPPEKIHSSYYVDLFKEKEVDGLILMDVISKSPAFRKLEATSFPYVTIGQVSKDQKGSFVDNDNFKKSFLTTEHLIVTHDIKNIAYLLGGALSDFVYNKLVNGFREALSHYSIPVEEEKIRRVTPDLAGGYEGMQALLKTKPQGIVLYGSFIFFGALRAIRELGLKMPDDVAIISCCETISPYMYSEVTQVVQPVMKMGSLAGRLVLDLLSGRSRKPQQIIVQSTTLIAGHSCGCSPQNGDFETSFSKIRKRRSDETLVPIFV